jgi:hypothetical protein
VQLLAGMWWVFCSLFFEVDGGEIEEIGLTLGC